MLIELSVKNFALIEKMNLSFGPGFNVLTGETGAGKSILIGAINLILGGRASSELIRSGTEDAEVQALFTLGHPDGLKAQLEELGLPVQDEIIIRRVLSRSGRNRIYINGTMATLAQLAAIGDEIVAISGQHEHQQLLNPDRQILYLDQFGGLMGERQTLSRLHEDWNRKHAEVAGLDKKIRDARDKAELFQFQSEEIRAAGLSPGEDDELEKERTLLRNAEKIFQHVKNAYDLLYGQNGAVVESLDLVRNDLTRAESMDDRLSPLTAQVEDAYHQLDDAAAVLRDHLERIVFDPQRLDDVEERLAVINRLKRKYGQTLGDVLNYGRQTSSHLDHLAEMERQREVLGRELESLKAALIAQAQKMSETRKDAARKMAAAVESELRTLGMPRLRFDIAFKGSQKENQNGKIPGPLGFDDIDFLVAPNMGEDLLPLAKIASGGELSRATLGIKSLLAGRDRVETIIFDEVDTGIGGAVAEVVGRKLKNLSGFHQLLCITHLPQIAAFGDHHHRVYKEERDNRTVTVIDPVEGEGKVEEIARMLGGIEPTEKTREAAREMIVRSCG